MEKAVGRKINLDSNRHGMCYLSHRTQPTYRQTVRVFAFYFQYFSPAVGLVLGGVGSGDGGAGNKGVGPDMARIRVDTQIVYHSAVGKMMGMDGEVIQCLMLCVPVSPVCSTYCIIIRPSNILMVKDFNPLQSYFSLLKDYTKSILVLAYY